MRFEGIYTPVITPLNDDYSIDWNGFSAMLEYLIANKIHGIVVGGTTGESYALSSEERVKQFKHASEIIKGRLPWIAGVNDLRTEDVCSLAVAARQSGADGLLLGSPPYSVPTDKELALHCLNVDRAANLPIMLYNYPGRTGAMMGEEFLERVARNPNFCAIKESTGDVNRIHLLAREFPHIQLSCGADDQALEFFVWGARSWVCAEGNFMPEEIIALYEACCLKKDFDKGRQIMSALLPLTTVLERGGKFVQCVKYGASLEGLPSGPVRQPLRAATKELKRQMNEVIFTAKTAIQKILATD